jgi:streptogramin lyase
MLEARSLPSTGLIVASFDSGQVLHYDGTTGSFLGTFATGLPDDHPTGMTIGPDGNLYVGVNNFAGGQASFIRRFDGQTGTFLDTFASRGGLNGPGGVTFGPDGNLYVASFGGLAPNSKVIRYDGITGAYIDDFVPVGSGGLSGATSLAFGPDRNLYVTSRVTDQVLRYNGRTGAFMDVFATVVDGNNGPQDLVFGPDGNLYVLDDGNQEVVRFNGVTGQFIDVFARGNFGTDGIHLVFGPDSNLYVTSGFIGNSVLRFNGVTGQFIDTFVPSGSGGLSYATGLLFFPPQVVVTNVNDSGAGSLRQAIVSADAGSGPVIVTFAIPGSGVQTIHLLSPLPAITTPVVIDGTSQPGYAGQPLIVLDGSGAGDGADGLMVAAGDSTVRGLVINRFAGAAIRLEGAGGDLIIADYLGTDATGTIALGNGAGVFIDGASDNTIGGITPAAGNLISGSRLDGVVISGSGNLVEGNRIGTDVTGAFALPNRIGVSIFYIGSNNTIGGTAPGAGNLLSGNRRDGVAIAGGSGNLVEGNRIGTDASGTAALGNRFGIELFSGSAFSTVGGTAAGAGNVIAGNRQDGVGIYSDGNLLEGNFIGTDPTGSLDLGNGGNGIAIRSFQYGYRNTIGGSEAGAGNTIADNGQDGVFIDTGTGNAIQHDAIFANRFLGIELRNGGNLGQAAPVLTLARSNGTSTTVTGTLTAAPSTTFSVEFFANTVCDPSGFGQGERFLGFALVTTDAAGQASFTATLGVNVNPGQFITATATDPAGNTSEFSNCTQVERGGLAALTLLGASDPGLAGMPDGLGASGRELAPAQSPAQIQGVPIVPGSMWTPSASDFAAPITSVRKGTGLSPETVPHAVVGTAPFDPLSPGDLDALALNLVGGP